MACGARIRGYFPGRGDPLGECEPRYTERRTFSIITRRNQFVTVKNNIEMLVSRQFHVKVNMVVMKALTKGNCWILWGGRENFPFMCDSSSSCHLRVTAAA